MRCVLHCCTVGIHAGGADGLTANRSRLATGKLEIRELADQLADVFRDLLPTTHRTLITADCHR